MTPPTHRQKTAKLLRIARRLHRTTGALLFVFFFIVAITGLLLGWKKHSRGVIQAPTYKGSTTELKNWLPLDSLYRSAAAALNNSISPDLPTELDRIDLRPDKGVAKFLFAHHFWGVQVDGATGKILQIEQRRSDVIEKIHDGSLLDFYASNGEGFKLFYTTVMGLALLLFTVTGFWLWYGPKRMRRR